MEKVDILYFSHFRDISFSFHMTEREIYTRTLEFQFRGIIWKDFNRFWEIISIDSRSNWALPCHEFFSHWLRQILQSIGILMLSCQLPAGPGKPFTFTKYFKRFVGMSCQMGWNFLLDYFACNGQVKERTYKKPSQKKSDWFKIGWYY